MKKNSQRPLVSRLSTKTVFLLGTAVPFVLYLVAYIVNGVYPFGGKLLLDADAFHQYLPFLTEFRRKLVGGGSLFYSFSGGLGYNFWATIAYYAASPLNLLLVFVPEANVCDYMIWLSVIKVSLCGGILAWYLFGQNKSNGIFSVAFGTMYALSSYLLSYKYNLMWLDSIAVVPFVMFGLEKIVHGKHPGCYLLSLFYAIWCNYYIGYILCVFSVLYLIFLFFTEDGLDKMRIVKSAISFLISSIIAGGMAAVLLVPSFLALRASTAMVGGENAGVHLYNNIISMFRAHYMESPSFRISYNRGDVHLYCGMAALPLAAIFFTDKTIRKKLRIGYAIFLGILLLSFTFSPLNFIWHGFHNETGVPNRFSFLYDILLLKLCYFALPGLKNVEETRLNRIILGIFGVSAVFAVWDMIGQHEFKVTISLGCLALYTVLLYEIRTTPKQEKQFSIIISVLIIIEAGVWGMIDLSLNGEGRVRSEVVEYQRDFKELLSQQGEEGFYRSEVDKDSTNFITYVGGNGISFFNSTMQDSICQFLGGVNLHSELNMVVNNGGTKLIKDFLGEKYLVTEYTDSERLIGFEKISHLNGLNLYKNKEALHIGFMVPEEITSWKPEPGNGMQGQNDLAQILCGVKEMFPLIESFTAKNGEPITFEIPDEMIIYVSLDEEPYDITWDTPEYSRKYEMDFEYLLLPAQATKDHNQATLTVHTIDGSDVRGKVYCCKEADYQQLIKVLSENQLENVRVSGRTVFGNISVQKDGILLMTIPYNEGWHITSDGATVAFQKIGGALIGIPLSKGTHQISMQFTPPGFTSGCIISAAFLLITGVFLLIHKKKNIIHLSK